MKNFKNLPLLVAGALILVVILIVCIFLKWQPLCFKSIKVGDVPGMLAPLAVAAAIIERAVEILISPWRDEEASKLQKALDAIKARAGATPNAQDADALKTASDALDAYRGDTQRYAFAVSITLSALVSVTGYPSLALFVDLSKCPGITECQGHFFRCVDVLLSAALLSGGADGIHSVVNAITSFFDATAEKSSKTT